MKKQEKTSKVPKVPKVPNKVHQEAWVKQTARKGKNPSGQRTFGKMAGGEGQPAAKQGVKVSRPALPNSALTGIYQPVGAFGRVIPDDRREIKEIMILQGSENGAQPGDRVVVTLTPAGSYASIKKSSGIDNLGKISEVLGSSADPATGVQAVIRRLGLRQEFSSKQLAAADKLNQPVTPEAAAKRADWREKLLVTIDGEDTRDIDDAISLERLVGGLWRLGVHIADVANYVTADSWLDKEAFNRSTSVYFPERVLPMLPPALSNGICSLNAGEDRLALSCLMTLNQGGQVVSYTLEPTLVRIREKLSYPQVQGYLNKQGWSTRAALAGNGGKAPQDNRNPEHIYFQDRSLEPMLLDMAKLCLLLRQARCQRGAIDFDFPECKIQMAPDGTVADVVRKERMLSEMMIEEFMILANETVATHYHSKGVPFLYRVHESPAAESIRELNQSLNPFGLAIKLNPYQNQKQKQNQKSGQKAFQQQEEGSHGGSGLEPHAYQQVLNQVKNLPEETVVSTLLLRSLAHARYSPKALGHFGLASPYYSHFTSPIRRYADLAIHRIIKALGMEGTLSEEEKQGLQAQMERCGEQTSLCERVAEEAERKVDALKKAEYMGRFIGEEFDGVISGVTSYGLYIALPNTVEGMVHISKLDDYYEFDEAHFRLYSYRGRKSYSLGDKVRVRLVQVDAAAGFVDFDMLENIAPKKSVLGQKLGTAHKSAGKPEGKSEGKPEGKPVGQRKSPRVLDPKSPQNKSSQSPHHKKSAKKQPAQWPAADSPKAAGFKHPKAGAANRKPQ